MATNHVAPGEILELTAPAGGVTSGKGYVIGRHFVVAMITAAAAALFTGARRGIFAMTKAASKTFAVGDPVYFDNTAKTCSDKASDTLIGYCTKAAASGDANVEVLLTGEGVDLDGGALKAHADDQTTPAIPAVFPVDIPSGADGDVDVVVKGDWRVVGYQGFMEGAGTAGSTLTVKESANALSNVLDVSGYADGQPLVFTKVDDVYNDLDDGDTLRVSKASTGGDFPGAKVYVQCLPR